MPIMLKKKSISVILSRFALGLFTLFSLFLFLGSLFYTHRLDEAHYVSQHILRFQENELTNGFIFLFIWGCIFLVFRKITISDRFLSVTTCVLFSLYGLMGLIWTIGAKAIPMSDQEHILRAAKLMIDGNIAPFGAEGDPVRFYFIRFPFQFGFLAYVELLVRLFGERGYLIIAPAANILYLICGDLALLRITKELFRDNRVTFLTLLLMVSGIQPLLGSTLLYGTYPAFCCTAWGLYHGIQYLKKHSIHRLICSTGFMALAVMFKSNALIPLLALTLTFLLDALAKPRLRHFLFALIFFLAAALPLPKAMQALYETRTDTTFGPGLPKVAWAAMSSGNSWMAPGWYSTYCIHLYEDNGGDLELCKAQAAMDLKNNLKKLQDSGELLSYYQEKLLSQWNEISFQSVWTSRVCETTGEISPLHQAVYEGRLKVPLSFLMNQYVQFLYGSLFLYGLFSLFRPVQKEQLLLPILLLGAFLFHLLFEAKAQYCLTYLPIMAPLCAASIVFPKQWKE